MSRRGLAVLVGMALVLSGAGAVLAQAPTTMLNVSYDPTRELYQEFNTAFGAYWKSKTGQTVEFQQSHGGSGKQARSVIDGLEADVVTLALAYDIDAIAEKAGLMPKDWQKRLPNNSCPYTSTIAFLVRKGNPKKIKDWDDLIRSDVQVITPNPKTSGAARWSYLAAWGYALKKWNDPAKAQSFMGQIFANVPVLDTGARGSTNTFVQRGLGDVLLAWENEAILAVNELGKDKFEIVYPPMSILAEPPVTVVDKVATKRGTLQLAKAYLEYLYSPEGQEIVVKHYYRPSSPEVLKKHETLFPKIKLITVEEVFGSWAKAQKDHFEDGGTFDQIYKK